jgi:hypothetical protein
MLVLTESSLLPSLRFKYDYKQTARTLIVGEGSYNVHSATRGM